MHIMKGYVQYQLPFGRGRAFGSSASSWVNALIGDWDVTWIFKYNSGNPLGITPNISYPGWEGVVYADLNQSVDLSGTVDPTGFNPGQQKLPSKSVLQPFRFFETAESQVGQRVPTLR